MADTPRPPTVSRETLVKLDAGYKDLLVLFGKQHALAAEMIRGCIQQIRKEPGSFDTIATRKEHARQRALAFLHLEALATQLENASDNLTRSNKG